MAFLNNTLIVRRDLMTKLVSLFNEGVLLSEIDRVPLKMSPKKAQARGRCCIHKERAVLKYKIMPILGYSIEEEEDELTPLSEYARKALLRTEKNKSIFTVVDEACTACVKTNYVVTNLCKGCVARACYMNCPREAVFFKENGQAGIDHNKCINCGICKEACPYHSIVFVPVPCEESCPVKAIQKDENGIEHIDESKCIFCGKCINACPFGSIFEISQIFDVLSAIQRNEKITAIVAPSVQSQFEHSFSDIATAIKNIGFSEIIEVALGAMETAFHEGEELQQKLEQGQQFMTTSCCPSYVELTKKHLIEMKPFVSQTNSPMYYASKIAKNKYPDSKVCFIGPCVGKRKEAADDQTIDYVLTFEELDAILKGMKIEIIPTENKDDAEIKAGRGFAQSGGVIAAVMESYPNVGIKPLIVTNIDKKNIALLKAYAKGKAPGNFIEVMACEGGCISGPCTINTYKDAQKIFKKVVEEN
ncbi:MAG TPA: monomeric [FeFe] hydrogenase [Paludibacteraceae bacterium]|nr:monomeric [FeFe] hydrogenase [Paludibacteraceae bacterium]HON01605.1 monomeric [FeFe] hydrogenase [Paludibacteraceae bacterium]HPQ11870.1 monomeric [FeFe] hydrogenase [Paludibacteraceae bacterium]